MKNIRHFLRVLTSCVLIIVICLNYSLAITIGPTLERFDKLAVGSIGPVDIIAAENYKSKFLAWKDHDTGEYRSYHSTDARARSIRSGVVSSNTIKANLSTSVSKRSVFDGVLKNARSYGRAGLKGFGWWSLAWQIAGDVLRQKGYEWKDEAQDFVRQVPDANYICVSKFGGEADCLKAKDKIVQVLPEVYSNRQYYELKAAMCDRWFARHPPAELPQGYTLAGAGISGDGQYCLYTGNPGGVWISASLQSGRKTVDVNITSDIFAEAAEPIADNAPSDWVSASRNDNGAIPNISKPTVTVPDGTIAHSSPYTNPKTGNAEQVTWTFHTPTGGATTVTEQITLRPDLTPNSPQAPAVTPPETKPETTPDEKDKDKQPTESGLCDQYPGILACEQMGKPDESIFQIEIPRVTDERTWQPDNFLPADGVCPSPKTFHVFGRPFQISYEPLCNFMRQVRFIILIAFVLMSAKIVFGSLRSK